MSTKVIRMPYIPRRSGSAPVLRRPSSDSSTIGSSGCRCGLAAGGLDASSGLRGGGAGGSGGAGGVRQRVDDAVDRGVVVRGGQEPGLRSEERRVGKEC